MQWFDVSKAGLAKLVEGRPKVFLLHELISNSWDETGTTLVNVQIEPEPGRPEVTIAVEDDSPDGFRHLEHAWTLFASNPKRADPSSRGRFTFGEKLVLALATEARIVTTTGSVVFDGRGRTTSTRHKRERGSLVEVTVRMTRAEMDAMRADVDKLIPPKTTTVNGHTIPHRFPIASFEARLPTVLADADGSLRPTARVCRVDVYHPRAGEVPSVYEMGIPIVETGDALHVDVQQKVPLNFERDNVPPSYLRALRGLVLEHARAALSKEDLTQSWVTEAAGDSHAGPEAVAAVLDARFGPKRVASTVGDRESDDRSQAAGYSVIHGGALPGEVWAKVKEHGLAPPSREVTPAHVQEFSPDGEPVKYIAPDKWTADEGCVISWIGEVAAKLLDHHVEVRLASDARLTSGACYGNRELILNKLRLGGDWFRAQDGRTSERVIRLTIHELAHDRVANHLSDAFHEECCRLGARLAVLIATGKVVL